MFAASIQGESFSKKQVSKRPRYNEGLTPHGRTYLWAWVLCAGPCFPLAFLSGSWAHATQNSLLYLPLTPTPTPAKRYQTLWLWFLCNEFIV